MTKSIKLICGWCEKGFDHVIYNPKSSFRNSVICPHCGRQAPSSKKEYNGNVVGKKHFHVEYKDGDRT